jgi:hypothetical protein
MLSPDVRRRLGASEVRDMENISDRERERREHQRQASAANPDQSRRISKRL